MSGETPAVREALAVYAPEAPETERVPPGYKQTEVGMIPEDWKLREIQEGCSVFSGHHVLAKNSNIEGEGVPYLTGPADFPEGVIKHTKFTTKPTTLCRNEDILVTVKGSGSGALIQSDGIYCISRQLMAIRVVSWNNQYVFYYLLHRSPQLEASVTGLIPGLSRSDILNRQIAVPSLHEQRAIAAALSDVDALISSLDRLISKKRAVKTAAMQQLLTGKQRLTGFSGEWEVKQLGDVFAFLSTASNPRSDLSEHGEVGYIHYGDIHGTDSSFLDCDTAKIPHIASHLVKHVPFLEEGDLVMADASEDYDGIGKSIEVKNVHGKKLVAGLHTLLLRGNKATVADGFKGYLQYIPALRSALTRLATGISVYGISKNNVRSVEISLPEIEEQTAIAAVLSDMDAEISALEARREKTRRIKQGMMQELLTGRTRLA
jgi:type I restriction enzyme S subunit